MANEPARWPPTSLLGGLRAPSRDRLLVLGTLARYPGPGHALMHEGDVTTFVLVLLDGVVKATGATLDGREALLAIRMGGDLVGELAALDGQPRSATVMTGSAVTARLIRSAEFLDCLRRDPHLAQAVDRSITTKPR